VRIRNVARWALGVVIFVGGCATAPPPAPAIPEIRPGILAGYLAPDALPDSVALLPPAPEAGSAAMAADEAANRASLALYDTPRWTLARADAELMFPAAATTFACALDAAPNEGATPGLYRLLRRTLADAGLSTYAAKNRYARSRPFIVNGGPLCTPEQRPMLETDGSYPSGHSAIGWAWALVLAELAPDRTNEILARGRAFGDSRAVCNVHWASDVEAGRTMGAATVARLHADATFAADLAQARDELEALRAKAGGPGRDCAAEAAALAR
jgi:acid phosphatase (class A)